MLAATPHAASGARAEASGLKVPIQFCAPQCIPAAGFAARLQPELKPSLFFRVLRRCYLMGRAFTGTHDQHLVPGVLCPCPSSWERNDNAAVANRHTGLPAYPRTSVARPLCRWSCPCTCPTSSH